MNGVNAHFQNSDCGLLFTTPTLITSDELLESYSSSSPQSAKLRTSWHNLIDLCQNQNAMIYLRVVYPEITLSGDRKTKDHLQKFKPLYTHFTKFSGLEIDLTNGLLHSVCQNNFTLQKQIEYINIIIQHISEATDLRISLRLSCLQHIHLLSSPIPFNKNVSLIHLVDVKGSLLKSSSMLALFSYFNGSDPPINNNNIAHVNHDLLLYRIENFDRIKKHSDLAATPLSPSLSSSASTVSTLVENSNNNNVTTTKPDLDYPDPFPPLPQTTPSHLNLRHRPTIRRTGSPMTRRKTGFQDEIASFAGSQQIHTHADDLSLRIAAWGWTILILVWVTFILGVGSIFGLRDLALGKAKIRVENYRDYEKESGYPIPFYYPCLIILCFVIAWVWCIISWMGMKFFRHAKAGIDD